MWCRTNSNFAANSSNCKWRHMPVRWTVDSVPNEFRTSEFSDIITTAFAAWESVSGFQAVQADQNPNIIFQAGRIDGRNGILAQAELPCGNVNENTQLKVQVDISENWADYSGSLHGGMMDLLRVVTHELGHSLGISHCTTESALMNPSVSDIRTVKSWDIEQAVLRYGAKAAPSLPSDGTPLLDCLQSILELMGNPDSSDEMAASVDKTWEFFKRQVRKSSDK
jgi:hypothetical protein